MVIEIENLTKFYGRAKGIEGVSLAVREGEIFGFLGPNGAGKTTTIRILLDFIRATSGSALIFGKDVRRNTLYIKSRLGYLPSEYGMYDAFTGGQYLKFIGAARKRTDEALTRRLVESFGLDTSKKVKSYSHGNRQKLAIVQAFMHDPDLLILDEPTSGLDPLVQQAFYKLLLEEKGRGKTIFMSSHVLSEVERVCDRAAILKEGRLAAVHEIHEIKKLRIKRVEIEFAEEVNEKEFALEGVRRMEKEGKTIRLWIEANISGVLHAISEHPVENMTFADAGIEDIFMEYY